MSIPSYRVFRMELKRLAIDPLYNRASITWWPKKLESAMGWMCVVSLGNQYLDQPTTINMTPRPSIRVYPCQPHNFFYCLIVGSKPLRIEISPIAVVKWCKIYEICHTRLQSIKGRLIEYNLNVVYHTYTTTCFAWSCQHAKREETPLEAEYTIGKTDK